MQLNNNSLLHRDDVKNVLQYSTLQHANYVSEKRSLQRQLELVELKNEMHLEARNGGTHLHLDAQRWAYIRSLNIEPILLAANYTLVKTMGLSGLSCNIYWDTPPQHTPTWWERVCERIGYYFYPQPPF